MRALTRHLSRSSINWRFIDQRLAEHVSCGAGMALCTGTLLSWMGLLMWGFPEWWTTLPKGASNHPLLVSWWHDWFKGAVGAHAALVGVHLFTALGQRLAIHADGLELELGPGPEPEPPQAGFFGQGIAAVGLLIVLAFVNLRLNMFVLYTQLLLAWLLSLGCLDLAAGIGQRARQAWEQHRAVQRGA